MIFTLAYREMKNGSKIRRANWKKYWYWNEDKDAILEVNPDGSEIDIRDTESVDSTIMFCSRDDWEIIEDEENDSRPESEKKLWKKGDKEQIVRYIQGLLNNKGLTITVTGLFDDETDKAVREFQSINQLVVDGVVGEKTLAVLEGEQHNHFLNQSDIEWAAAELGCEVAAVLAVSEVESRGKGFFKDNSPAVLFERHIMRRRLMHYNINPEPYEKQFPGLVNKTPGGYEGGMIEHERIRSASEIHRPSAFESASWGTYQIMGFHWKSLGYVSIDEFVRCMEKDEFEHLKAFVRFNKNDARLLKAIREKDWSTYARVYNGPGYRNHKVPYDDRLLSAYNRFSKS